MRQVFNAKKRKKMGHILVLLASLFIVLLFLLGNGRKEVNNKSFFIDSGIRIIREFYLLLLQEETPKVKDVERIFGPHEEFELGLLLKDCMHQKLISNVSDWIKSEKCIKYVNERLNNPNKYDSQLFIELRKRPKILFNDKNFNVDKLIITTEKIIIMEEDYAVIDFKVTTKEAKYHFIFSVSIEKWRDRWLVYIANIYDENRKSMNYWDFYYSDFTDKN